MDISSFNNWLRLYGKAWTQRNPDLIGELFTNEAKYSEKPFAPPFEGIKAITTYWKVVCETQRDIHFDYKILSVNNDVGIAHFTASFLRQPQSVQVKLDGIFHISFNSQNKCINFSEWWQSQKSQI